MADGIIGFVDRAYTCMIVPPPRDYVMLRIVSAGSLVLALAAPASSQAQTTLLHMQCQKNLQDGRILIANGLDIPEGAQVGTVRNFRQQRADADRLWAFGPCDVSVTMRAGGSTRPNTQQSGAINAPASLGVMPARGAVLDQRVVAGRAVQVIQAGRGEQTIALNGHPIINDTAIRIQGVYGDFVVFFAQDGGTSCPTMYRALNVAQVVMSKPFGNCSDIPQVTLRDGILHVILPAFRGSLPGSVTVASKDFQFSDGKPH